MSTTFTIINNYEILTTTDISKLIDLQLVIGKKSSITFDEWFNGAKYNSKVNEIETINLGIENKSLRGINLFYHDDKYNIKVNSPANSSDWKLAIKLLSKMSNYLHNDIFNIEENRFYNNVNIFDFNYENEILEGIAVIKTLSTGDFAASISGFNLDIFIDHQFLVKLDNDTEKIIQYATALQWDAYAANPGYILKQNKLWAGYFILSSNILTHLPKLPILPEEYEMSNDEDVVWVIIFRDSDEGQVGVMDYSEFISKNYNLELADGNNFKCYLELKEMKIMLRHRKKTNKIIEFFDKQ